MRKKIVAGNWKMNNSLLEGLKLIDDILKGKQEDSNVIKVIATPFIHLTEVARQLGRHNDFKLAAQNCHHQSSGAFTGEVSAEMIASTGASYVIIGHSERRMYFKESNELLLEKAKAALQSRLIPIFCIGENLEERNSGKHKEVVKNQLSEAVFNLPVGEFAKIVLAYEPVWAIGTGVTATTEQAQEMHQFIREEINKKYGQDIAEAAVLLYGGSCNAQNAKELFACKDVDGGLIGGASLKAGDFNAIINSFS